MKLLVQDNLSEKLFFLVKGFPGLCRRIGSRIAAGAAKHIRQNKLSGQALNIITGETKKSTKFFREKGKAGYGIRPGVGIRGRKNYLLRFTRKGNPFMQQGLADYQLSGRIAEIGNKELQKEIKKRGF